MTENNQSYSYDANGNLLDDGRFTYSWDAENRLLSATNKTNGAISSFTYDGLSHRISNTETVKDRAGNSQSTTTYYQWCGDTLCMALDSNSAVTERYYAQGEQINGKNRYYATDKLGSVMQVVNANGSLLGESRYDAYGKRELAVGIQPRFGYAGMFRHEPTGLNLTLYRAYNPQTGRWLSRDPIGERGGLNIYAYVGNDPLGYIDPYGLWAWGDPLPQGSVDFSAGMGDAITFGGTSKIRDFMGTNGAVNQCSGAYTSGVVTGIVVQSIIFSGENSAFTREAAISTGRTEAQTLEEQLAMQEVKSNPSGYTPDRMPAMSDTKNGLLAKDGWVKRTQNVNDVEVHYVENTRTGQTTDFKFKD